MTGEKKSFRINIVDILITIIIIAMLTVGALMIASAFDVKSAGDDIVIAEYVVQFKRVRNEFSDNIHVGDVVIDAQKRHNLGVVTFAESMPYLVELYDVEEESRKAIEYPDFCNLEMTVSAEAYKKDNMWYLKNSDKEIGIGTALYIHLPNFCGSGYISEMNIIEQGD